MIRHIFLYLFASLFLYAVPTIKSAMQIETNGTVKDMVLHDMTLLIATDNGQAQVYDYEKNKFTETLRLPNIKDFMGDSIPARVFSVDKMDNRYLLLSDSGKGGYVNLWLIQEGKRTQLLSATDKYTAIKARFINKDKILLGLLSNEAVLFDVVDKKEVFRVQLSESKFSDFALNLDRSQAVFACESGILNIIDTRSGKVLYVLKGQNVDNVYKVDFKKGIVSAAGQDRRAALYDVQMGKDSYISGNFLIYATGLSPSEKRVAFALDEDNSISVFNTKSKTKIAILKGQKSTPNTILFKDENVLFTASDDDTVMMWKLP